MILNLMLKVLSHQFQLWVKLKLRGKLKFILLTDWTMKVTILVVFIPALVTAVIIWTGPISQQIQSFCVTH